MSATDFAGILRMLAQNKRTGTLQIVGDNFSADIDFSGGSIIRVDVKEGSSWPLGEILREIHLVPADRLDRALRLAMRRKTSPEAVLLDRGWVSLPILKRYRERLNLAALLDLAMRAGFRAEFHPASNHGSGLEGPVGLHPWDAEIPVAYALKELGRRLQSIKNLRFQLPRPGDRFDKVAEAVAYILGREDPEVRAADGRTVALTPTDRRVFFFCNGRVQFRNLPLIVGLPPEQVAAIIHRLLKLGAIRPSSKPEDRKVFGTLTRNAGRLVVGLASGAVVVGVMAMLVLKIIGWSDDRDRFPPALAAQQHLSDAGGLAFRAVQDALYVYFLNEGVYPGSLRDLVVEGYLRPEELQPARIGGVLHYVQVEEGLAYRLEHRSRARRKKASQKMSRDEASSGVPAEGGSKKPPAEPSTP